MRGPSFQLVSRCLPQTLIKVGVDAEPPCVVDGDAGEGCEMLSYCFSGSDCINAHVLLHTVLLCKSLFTFGVLHPLPLGTTHRSCSSPICPIYISISMYDIHAVTTHSVKDSPNSNDSKY